jgi:hypothetical protein
MTLLVDLKPSYAIGLPYVLVGMSVDQLRA